jgi:uncharacterized protein (DUF1697 family)
MRRMPVTWIALLRGVNVGKAKRIAMADLRSLVEGLGYGEVRTLLNSGNVVFSAPAKLKGDPAPRIEKAIAARLGVATRVTALTAAQLATIVEENALLRIANDPSRLIVTVLSDAEARGKVKPLVRQDWKPDALALGTHAAYLWCTSGTIDSKVSQVVSKALGDGATSRNWATILKLATMARSEAV